MRLKVPARGILAACDRLVSRVFDAAVRRAARLAGSRAAAGWAATTAGAAATYLPDATFAVRASPGLSCSPAAVASVDSALGIVVESADGRVRVEATLERFLVSERARLAQAIVARARDGEP